MASYQDIDIRLRVVEDKLAFLMAIIQVHVASPLSIEPPRQLSAFQAYLAAKQQQLGGRVSKRQQLETSVDELTHQDGQMTPERGHEGAVEDDSTHAAAEPTQNGNDCT